jgi:hypothetical protein
MSGSGGEVWEDTSLPQAILVTQTSKQKALTFFQVFCSKNIAAGGLQIVLTRKIETV